MENHRSFKHQLPVLLLLVCFAFRVCVSDPVFYESFDEPFDGRWTVSQKEDYKGVWEHAKSEGHDDYGLLVSEKAKKYAIVKELDKPLDLKEKTTVLQFETRFQEGLECGGAYLKYLRPQEAGWVAKEFDNESPYAVMFGPDRCGSTNKVHFILKHKNPKTGEYAEHHLKYPPSVPSDKLTHVYTAVLTPPDNEVRILIDGEEKKKGNFFSDEDFEPALVPAKTIPDPDDKKPKDWDEREKIPDPSAKKPDDWDEDAPMEIEDLDAVKPEGWLDDEPEEIDDPEATKPEDWDEEEDGEWEAPKIVNPKCEAGIGCGEWKRPTKRNPTYKGKWYAPQIDNPNYNGIWKPREIPNPNYFELSTPNFEPIAAIGIEIWTMQDGILFDNILIAGDASTAESYRDTNWKPKFSAEKEKQKAEDSTLSEGGLGSSIKKKVFEVLYKVADIPFLEPYKPQIYDMIDKAEDQATISIGVLVSIIVITISILLRVLLRGKKPAGAKIQKAKAATPEPTKTKEKENTEGKEEEKDEDENGATRRKTRREE